MKPFDLPAAKAGAPICSAEGLPRIFVAHLPLAKKDQRVVVVTGGGSVYTCSEDGVFLNDDGITDRDLFMVSKKRTVWVNLYADSSCFWHETEKEADMVAGGGRPRRLNGKAIPLEIEE